MNEVAKLVLQESTVKVKIVEMKIKKYSYDLKLMG